MTLSKKQAANSAWPFVQKVLPLLQQWGLSLVGSSEDPNGSVTLNLGDEDDPDTIYKFRVAPIGRGRFEVRSLTEDDWVEVSSVDEAAEFMTGEDQIAPSCDMCDADLVNGQCPNGCEPE